MPPRAPEPCLHELRPGTKVCLHCRRAEREARAAHRNRIFARITITAIALALGVVGVRAGLDAYQRGSLTEIPQLMAATTKALVESLPGTPAAPPAPLAIQQTVPGPAVPDSGTGATTAPDSTAGALPPTSSPATDAVSLVSSPAAPLGVPAGPPAVAPAAPMVAPPVAAAPVPPALLPIVAEGRTELAGGVYAVRSGDTVTVFFDTPEARTRRADKFEQIVRATLPAIHGSAGDALLASVAPGALVGAVDLVNELPTRGLHLRAADGRALSLWPETRPGRDGPLVVAYRATRSR
jgi:hypothetical protein